MIVLCSKSGVSVVTRMLDDPANIAFLLPFTIKVMQVRGAQSWQHLLLVETGK